MKFGVCVLLAIVAVSAYDMPIADQAPCPFCCKLNKNYAALGGIAKAEAKNAANTRKLAAGGCGVAATPRKNFKHCCMKGAHCCPAAGTKGAKQYGCCRPQVKKCTVTKEGNFAKCAALVSKCPADSKVVQKDGKDVMCGGAREICGNDQFCNAGSDDAYCCEGKPETCNFNNCFECAQRNCFWAGNTCLASCPTNFKKECSDKCTCANNNYDKPQYSRASQYQRQQYANGPWGWQNNNQGNNNWQSPVIVYNPSQAAPGTCLRRCGSDNNVNNNGNWGGNWGGPGFGGPGFGGWGGPGYGGYGGGFGGGYGGFGGYGVPIGGGYGFAPPVPPMAYQRCSCDDECHGRGDCCFDKCQICGVN